LPCRPRPEGASTSTIECLGCMMIVARDHRWRRTTSMAATLGRCHALPAWASGCGLCQQSTEQSTEYAPSPRGDGGGGGDGDGRRRDPRVSGFASPARDGGPVHLLYDPLCCRTDHLAPPAIHPTSTAFRGSPLSLLQADAL